MEFSNAIDMVKGILNRSGYILSGLDEMIIRGVINRDNYKQIALNTGYPESHIKYHASSLWHRLSNATGEIVRKNNFRLFSDRVINGKVGKAKKVYRKIPSLPRSKSIIVNQVVVKPYKDVASNRFEPRKRLRSSFVPTERSKQSKSSKVDSSKVERSIEFPSEYWEAGT
jgi:hypothetical protein